MANTQKVMRKSDANWEQYPDFKYRAKNVGTWRLELIGGSDRGAIINIWTRDKECMQSAVELEAKGIDMGYSDDRKFTHFTTANYMHFSSAKEDYGYANCNEEILILARRTY